MVGDQGQNWGAQDSEWFPLAEVLTSVEAKNHQMGKAEALAPHV